MVPIVGVHAKGDDLGVADQWHVASDRHLSGQIDVPDRMAGAGAEGAYVLRVGEKVLADLPADRIEIGRIDDDRRTTGRGEHRRLDVDLR